MHILHVIRGLANSSGTTHIVIPLSEEQARQGAEVSVYYVDKPLFPSLEPDPSLVESRCFASSLPLDNPGISIDFARAVNRNIRKFDVVHIHAVWNFPTWWTMRSAYKYGVPYMVAPQGSFETWALGQNPLGKKLYGMFTEIPLLKKATWLQALTQAELEQIRSAGLHAPAIIVPNGVDSKFFDRPAQNLAKKIGLPEGTKILLFLSRLHPKKGLEILIEAFSSFAQNHPEVVLIIAGHDAGSGYRTKIEELILHYGLTKRCRMIGEVKGDEKYEILLGADAFALTSYSEGLPVAVIEAMGAGLPVVVTPGCNLPEVVDYGAGLIVAPEPDKVAEALSRVFANEKQARIMGDKGRRLVEEKFTWKRIAHQLLEIYSQAELSTEQGMNFKI